MESTLHGFTIYRGYGNGEFPIPRRVFLDSDPSVLTVADIDQDGIDDICIDGNAHLGTVTGDFQFSGISCQTVQPFGTVIGADLNGDGQNDTVFTGGDSSEISVVIREGEERTVYTYNLGRPNYLSYADVNDDEIVDLVVASKRWSSRGVLYVLLGNGDGTFKIRQSLSTRGDITQIHFGDLNHDGLLDFVTGGVQNIDRVQGYLGKGNGEFVEQSYSFAGPRGRRLTALVGDFDGDGRTDLGAYFNLDSAFSIAFSRSTLHADRNLHLPVARTPSSVVYAAVNDDGVEDLITSSARSPELSVLLGDSEGDFAENLNLPVSNPTFDLVAGRWNDDHTTDFATANGLRNSVSILLASAGDLEFDETTIAVGKYPRSIAAADLNGDGVQDLVTANWQSHDLSLLMGSGDGSFAPEIRLETGLGPRAVETADVNNDGEVDLVVADGNADQVSVFLGQGNGTFDEPRTFAVGGTPTSLAIGDLDRDGDLDIAVANRASGDVSLLYGDGARHFVEERVAETGTPTALVLADMNSDDLLDIVIATESDSSHGVMLLADDNNQYRKLLFRGGERSMDVVAGDFDRDGVMDVAFANWGNDDVSVHYGPWFDSASQTNARKLRRADTINRRN